MKNKYEWLTKEILEQDYSELGNFKLLSQKYNIPRSTIERYCKIFCINTTPKIRYGANHNIFATDTETSFYLAGFIAADGCINQHKSNEPNYIGICLSKKDEQHLIKIKNLLEFVGPIKYTTRKLSKLNDKWKDSEQCKIDIYSKKMISDLKRFGIGPRKSLTYDFPNWLNDSPLVNHFIRGYFDGDGSFWINQELKNDRLIFSVRGTIIFLESLQKILNDKCGLRSITYPKKNNGIGQLTFKGQNDVKSIIKFMYNNSLLYLDRKFELAMRFL